MVLSTAGNVLLFILEIVVCLLSVVIFWVPFYYILINSVKSSIEVSPVFSGGFASDTFENLVEEFQITVSHFKSNLNDLFI
jgi:hypothetical protein